MSRFLSPVRMFLSQINSTVTKIMRPFVSSPYFSTKNTFYYPDESDNTMLFTMFMLSLFTLFVGIIGNPFTQEAIDLNILDKWLIPSINLLHESSKDYENWYEFVKNVTFSVTIAYFKIFIPSFFYKPTYSSLQNVNFRNSVVKNFTKNFF